MDYIHVKSTIISTSKYCMNLGGYIRPSKSLYDTIIERKKNDHSKLFRNRKKNEWASGYTF